MFKIFLSIAFLTPFLLTAEPRKPVFESKNKDRVLKVFKSDNYTYVTQNNATQSIESVGATFGSTYYDYFHSFAFFNFSPIHFFEIGMGAGINVKAFLSRYSKITFTTSEIDPEMVKIAKKFFSVKDDKRLKILIGDGRNLLKKQKKNFDVILIDAYAPYDGTSLIPKSVATKEFYELAHSKLARSGLVMMNVTSANKDFADLLRSSISSTMKQVFARVYFLKVSENQHIVIAAKGSVAEPVNNIVERIYSYSKAPVSMPGVDLFKDRLTEAVNPQGKIIRDSLKAPGGVLRYNLLKTK